ncbi:MAG: acyl-CoA dehydrogenase family protein [Chloroflexi bacterium]|nr:acyl-CoA dehydrogenase family protein [Chloroflexota bacterium]
MAEHYDKTHEYPWPVIKKAQEMGLTTMSIPEEYGGLGFKLARRMPGHRRTGLWLLRH